MVLGIDGCKSGWVVSHVHESQLLKIDLIANLEELDYANCSKIWIDCPLGLLEHEERICDKLLRKALGKKGASVFACPVRDAVYADSYSEASQLNYEKTGKKLSIQSWNICPKIKEVDQFVQHHPEVLTFMRESHPEFLFFYHFDKQLDKKKTKEGFEQRYDILKSEIANAELIKVFLEGTKRKDVLPDDVVDSVVLAIYAEKIQSNVLKNKSQIDEILSITPAIWY